MKVIKPGKAVGRWCAEYTCKRCSAILMVEQYDLYTIECESIKPDTFIKVVAYSCPECDFNNVICELSIIGRRPGNEQLSLDIPTKDDWYRRRAELQRWRSMQGNGPV